MSHLERPPGREIVAKWLAAVLSAHLVTLGVLGLGFGMAFTHPFRLRRFMEGEEASYVSLGYLAAGILIPWLTHRLESTE